MDRLLYARRVWLDGRFCEASIRLEDGKILAIYEGKKEEGAEDYGNQVIMPGVIDAHLHINEPGRTEWEGFKTATTAARSGGITTLMDMPLNSSPVTTTPAHLQQKREAARGKLSVNCGFYGGLIPGNAQEMEGLAEAGVFAIKAFLVHSGIDEFPNAGAADLAAALPILAKTDVPLLVHAELEGPAPLIRHPKRYASYLASRPKDWENKAIRWMIRLCREYGARIHIVHLSSAEALEDIREAKAEGLPLTVETCPHYILFHSEDIPDADTRFKCAPPIREKANNEQLKQALADGLIDFLASDHSPAPPEMKAFSEGDLKKAWGGIAGLQFLLPASWTALRGKMSLETFIPLLTEHPARFLGLDHRKGFIRTGYDADLVIWDPEGSFEVQEKDIQHRHKVSPYLGRKLYGKVSETIVDAQILTHAYRTNG